MKLMGSKWEILRILNQEGTATIDDLKNKTDLGITTLREHLEDLEEGSLIDYEKQSHGRGRPQHIYHITDRARELFPEPDDSLTQIFFKVFLKTLEPDQINRILRDTLVEYLHSTNKKIKEILENHDEIGQLEF